MSQEEFRFPEELATDVKRSASYIVENSDITTEEELAVLVELMFQFPERDFYLFSLKEQGANQFVASAERRGILLVERYETQYFPHPKNERDWIKINKSNPSWDWEKEVLENCPEYIRFTLKLTERWRRKLDLSEALSAAKPKEDANPIIFKPSFHGIGIDIPKAWNWLKAKWKKL